MGIALLWVGKLRLKFVEDVSAVNREKNKFEEVLQKAKIKRADLVDRTADRKAKELKKETEELAARDLTATPRPPSTPMQRRNVDAGKNLDIGDKALVDGKASSRTQS
jgi:hypothetical protein